METTFFSIFQPAGRNIQEIMDSSDLGSRSLIYSVIIEHQSTELISLWLSELVLFCWHQFYHIHVRVIPAVFCSNSD